MPLEPATLAMLRSTMTIDFTTIGRNSGQPRTIEIWWFHVDGRFIITGTPGTRDWLANIRANPAVVISVARMAVLYVPVAIVMQKLMGIAGIFGAYAFANIVSAVIAYWWARNSVQEQCDKHEEPILVSETA